MLGHHGDGVPLGLAPAEEAEDDEERHHKDEQDEEVVADAHLEKGERFSKTSCRRFNFLA